MVSISSRPPMQFSPPPTFSVVCLSFRSIPVWEKGEGGRGHKKSWLERRGKEKKKSIAVFVEPLFLSFARFLSARFGIKILQLFPFFWPKKCEIFSSFNCPTSKQNGEKHCFFKKTNVLPHDPTNANKESLNHMAMCMPSHPLLLIRTSVYPDISCISPPPPQCTFWTGALLPPVVVPVHFSTSLSPSLLPSCKKTGRGKEGESPPPLPLPSFLRLIPNQTDQRTHLTHATETEGILIEFRQFGKARHDLALKSRYHFHNFVHQKSI